MNTKLVMALAALAVSGSTLAQDDWKYRCTYGDMVRRVEIFHETGVSVPCEVHYYKDTEMPGERQVLWRAMNETGYCEARAEEFIAQLGDAGWSCSATDGGEPAEEAPESEADDTADDTETLTPAAPKMMDPR